MSLAYFFFFLRRDCRINETLARLHRLKCSSFAFRICLIKKLSFFLRFYPSGKMDSLWVDWQKIKEPLAIVIPGAISKHFRIIPFFSVVEPAYMFFFCVNLNRGNGRIRCGGVDDYVVGRIKFSHLFAPVKRNDNIMKIIVSASNTIQRTGRIIAIIIIKKLN